MSKRSFLQCWRTRAARAPSRAICATIFCATTTTPHHFLLYEVYRDAEALEAHRATPHFQKWAAAVEPWLAAPRTRVRAQPLFYEGEEV